uniref:Putative beta-lactamase family protein n=1 Tax=Paulinella micropora TaxID=1928728 RepID=A0A385I165_9EUKA|nr:putative beta-lactamase family protein [Paulinella micropora]AXY63677.1 putative beta-lactamase family protein [Paulinella micropora]
MSFGQFSSLKLQRWKKPLQLLFRLLIIGIGCSVLTGTSLRIMSFKLVESSPKKSRIAVELIPSFGKVVPSLHLYGGTKGFPLTVFQPRQKLLALNEKWSRLARNRPELTSSAFLLVLEDGRYAELNSNLRLPANNLIKFPLALIAINELDNGSLSVDKLLDVSEEQISSNNGSNVQSIDPQLKINEVLAMMIKMNSHNAINLLLKYFENHININKEFNKLGLAHTSISRELPDLKGENTISTRDLVYIQSNLIAGKNIGLYARDLFYDTIVTSLRLNVSMGIPSRDMQRRKYIQVNGFPTKGTTVYNKIGEFSITYADTGLVILPNGQHMIASFIIKGPLNNLTSKYLIQDMISASIPMLLPEE